MIYLFLSLYLDCVIFLHQLGIVSGESLGLRIDGFVYVFIVEVSIQNEQYLGFARAHAPYEHTCILTCFFNCPSEVIYVFTLHVM